MDYFEAYHERKKCVNDILLSFAKKFTEKGFEVFHSKSGLISFIHIRDEKNHIVLGFDELPYRWYLRYDIEPSMELGSCKTLEETFDLSEFSFEKIINSMKSNPKNKISKPDWYLKKY